MDNQMIFRLSNVEYPIKDAPTIFKNHFEKTDVLFIRTV